MDSFWGYEARKPSEYTKYACRLCKPIADYVGRYTQFLRADVPTFCLSISWTYLVDIITPITTGPSMV